MGTAYKLLYGAWVLVVTTHTVICLANLLGIILCCVYLPWWQAVVLATMWANWVCTPLFYCPLTYVENGIRYHMGWPLIAHFAEHYVFRWLEPVCGRFLPTRRVVRHIDEYEDLIHSE
jgi:hypothetical protein